MVANGSDKEPIEVPFTVAETGANTFTEAEIQLPTSPASNIVFDLDSVQYDMDAPGMAANTTGSIEFHVSMKTKSTALRGDDNDLIAKITRHTSNNSANAAFYSWYKDSLINQSTLERANLIALRSVFVGIKGTSQAAAKRCSGKLVGHLRKVSQNELTSLLLEASQ